MSFVRKVEKYDWVPEPNVPRTNRNGIAMYVDPRTIFPIAPPIPDWMCDEEPEAITDEHHHDLARVVVNTIHAAAVSHETCGEVCVSDRAPRTRAPYLEPGAFAPRSVSITPAREAAFYVDKDDALHELRTILSVTTCSNEDVQDDIDWIVEELGRYFLMENDLDQCSLLHSIVNVLT
jgi:hypothetical protein